MCVCLFYNGIGNAQHLGEEGHSIYNNINQVEFIYVKAYANILDVAKFKATLITNNPSVRLYYTITDDQCFYFLQWVQVKDLSTTDKQKMKLAQLSGSINCDGLMRFDFEKIIKTYRYLIVN